MDIPEILTLPDGRRLAWEDAGDRLGQAVLFCHGEPGCRLQRRVFIDDALLLGEGVRMITPDRPGLGWSGYQVHRRIEDWPADIAVLVDRLGLSRFAVLGFSGGTPYATALAASALSASALGIVSGDAPPGAVAGVPPGLGATADRRPRLTAMALRSVALMARLAPDFTADRATSMLPPVDREIVSDPALRRRFAAMIQGALRQGVQGALLDAAWAAGLAGAHALLNHPDPHLAWYGGRPVSRRHRPPSRRQTFQRPSFISRKARGMFRYSCDAPPRSSARWRLRRRLHRPPAQEVASFCGNGATSDGVLRSTPQTWGFPSHDSTPRSRRCPELHSARFAAPRRQRIDFHPGQS